MCRMSLRRKVTMLSNVKSRKIKAIVLSFKYDVIHSCSGRSERKASEELFSTFTTFCKRVQNEKGYCIASIRNDRGGEFINEDFETFCSNNDITHQVLAL